MTAEEAKQRLGSLKRFTKRRGFSDTRRVYGLLCEKGLVRPGEMRIVHVAGTNGKGSVSSALSSILECCGYSTGLFTSPHLIRLTERIRFGGEEIPEEELAALLELLEAEIPGEDMEDMGFFEAFFFLAMLWYSRLKPDFIILETGLGGRLDATNVIEKPALTLITRIALDHVGILGGTLREIALEKAGILRKGVPLVCLEEPEEAFGAIREKAAETEVPVFSLPPNKSLDFSLHFHYDNQAGFILPEGALYQRENLPLALKAAELLLGKVDVSVFQQGIDRFYWPSRFEEILPGVILDGAHNPDGMRAFLESVAMDGCSGERLLILAVAKDKDYREICRQIMAADLFSRVFCTEISSPRALGGEDLMDCFKGVCNIHKACFPSPDTALGEALRIRKTGDLIYLAGSLSLRSSLKAKYDQF